MVSDEALQTLSVVTEIVEGKSTRGGLADVSEHDVDTVTIGIHGRTGLDRVVTGSVAERVVRRSPVLELPVRVRSATACPPDSDPYGSFS
ncbi:universal stress protein [Haloarcula sp. JP-L23]|uniref:universal stress protein n=1 Tax=Haloarcula sp. JP-L23 TaxID=2716717 RepID=UPI00140F42DA|nr:universal stress protein [Haloarcula sp. JP-L23]